MNLTSFGVALRLTTDKKLSTMMSSTYLNIGINCEFSVVTCER